MRRFLGSFDLFVVPYIVFFLVIFGGAFPLPNYKFWLQLGIAIGLASYLAGYCAAVYQALAKLNIMPNISLRVLTLFWWIILIVLGLGGIVPILSDLTGIYYYALVLWMLPVFLFDLWLEKRVRDRLSRKPSA